MSEVELMGPILSEKQAVVSSDGTVLLVLDAVLKTRCAMDVTHFPFDQL